MTNSQLFSLPTFKVKVNKNLIATNAIPNVGEIEIIWGSLLGKSTHELTEISLLSSIKFANHVKKTREEFKLSVNNLRKFPKMTNDDWE